MATDNLLGLRPDARPGAGQGALAMPAARARVLSGRVVRCPTVRCLIVRYQHDVLQTAGASAWELGGRTHKKVAQTHGIPVGPRRGTEVHLSPQASVQGF